MEAVITTTETVKKAEEVLHALLIGPDSSETTKRQVAQFILEFNHEVGTSAPKEGLATKEDIVRLGRVIGEVKEILEGSLREGGRTPGASPTCAREPVLSLQGRS